MPKQIFEKHPVFPFSKAIVLNPYVFVSGMVAPKSELYRFISEQIKYQTSWLIQAVEKQLEKAGSSMKNIQYLRIFLTDVNNAGEVNLMFSDYFGEDLPACSFIQVSALPSPNALVEVEAIASIIEFGLMRAPAQ
jgi:2-iminobutanoate/2-iminopropanoate deaminase